MVYQCSSFWLPNSDSGPFQVRWAGILHPLLFYRRPFVSIIFRFRPYCVFMLWDGFYSKRARETSVNDNSISIWFILSPQHRTPHTTSIALLAIFHHCLSDSFPTLNPRILCLPSALPPMRRSWPLIPRRRVRGWSMSRTSLSFFFVPTSNSVLVFFCCSFIAWALRHGPFSSRCSWSSGSDTHIFTTG